jgi:hypothetical protein
VSTGSVSAYANFVTNGYSYVAANASVSPNGKVIGEDWNIVPDSDNTWIDVESDANTWTEISASDNTWTDIATTSNTWTQPINGNNTWQQQN